jgi:hypothetical protein
VVVSPMLTPEARAHHPRPRLDVTLLAMAARVVCAMCRSLAREPGDGDMTIHL